METLRLKWLTISAGLCVSWRKIKHIFNPGSLLALSLPNIDTYKSKLFRSHRYGVDLSRHLFHYSPTTITALVNNFDFDVDTVDHFCREHNGGVILGSVISLSPPDESFPHKLLRKTIGKYVTDTLGLLESSLGKGGTFTLFAIKK